MTCRSRYLGKPLDDTNADVWTNCPVRRVEVQALKALWVPVEREREGSKEEMHDLPS